MGRFGRYLEGIACFDGAGRLTLYGKLEAALQDIGRFDSRMRVSPDGRASLYCRFHKQRHIARRRTVCLRQDLSRDTARRCGRRTLGRRFGGNKLRNSADRARRKTRESSSSQHDTLPACVWIASAQTFVTAYRKSFTIWLAMTNISSPPTKNTHPQPRSSAARAPADHVRKWHVAARSRALNLRPLLGTSEHGPTTRPDRLRRF